MGDESDGTCRIAWRLVDVYMYGVRWGDDVISVRKPKVPWITRGVCAKELEDTACMVQ